MAFLIGEQHVCLPLPSLPPSASMFVQFARFRQNWRQMKKGKRSTDDDF